MATSEKEKEIDEIFANAREIVRQVNAHGGIDIDSINVKEIKLKAGVGEDNIANQKASIAIVVAIVVVT